MYQQRAQASEGWMKKTVLLYITMQPSYIAEENWAASQIFSLFCARLGICSAETVFNIKRTRQICKFSFCCCDELAKGTASEREDPAERHSDQRQIQDADRLTLTGSFCLRNQIEIFAVAQAVLAFVWNPTKCSAFKGKSTVSSSISHSYHPSSVSRIPHFPIVSEAQRRLRRPKKGWKVKICTIMDCIT